MKYQVKIRKGWEIDPNTKQHVTLRYNLKDDRKRTRTKLNRITSLEDAEEEEEGDG